LEVPPLTDQGGKSILNASVGVSGTNAVLIWTEPANDAAAGFPEITNIVLTRISGSKEPLDAFWRTVTPGFRGPERPRLLPSQTGFFLLYEGMVATNSPVQLLATRIDSLGTPMFAPVPIVTNVIKSYRASSNGKTVLVLYETLNAGQLELHYKLIDANGASIASGALTDAEERRYAVGCDGTNYLAVWQARTSPYIRASHIISDTGSSSTTVVSDSKVGIQGIGHGKNGYLIATEALLFQVSDEGTLLSQGERTYRDGQYPSVFDPAAVIAEDDGWVVFTMRSSGGSGSLYSVRVTPGGGALNVEPSGYRADYAPSNAFDLPACVTRFGPGEILVITQSSCVILSRTGTIDYFSPRIYETQTTSCLADSPFGYLAAWYQSNEPSAGFRVLRTAKDGTRLDGHSFPVGKFDDVIPRSCVFDGSDYVIGFLGFVNSDPGESNYIARISPSGAPDVRVSPLTFPDAEQSPMFRLLRHQNKTYVIYDGPDGTTPLEKHIAELSPVNTLEAPVSIHAESIEFVVSDGENIYTIQRDSGSINLVRLDLVAAQPEVRTNRISSGALAYGASVHDGFVIWWEDSQQQWDLAYFTHGVQQFSAKVPFYPLTVIQSSNRLLAAGVGGFPALPYGYQTFSFQTFDLQTHETATAKRALPWYLVLRIASAGDDFFCTTERISNGSILRSFWVTDTEQPSFSPAVAGENAIRANLSLNPNRRYRIESSTDFTTWSLRDVISGVSRHEVLVGGNEKEFIRATLVPE
jgi:hypothetical protein